MTLPLPNPSAHDSAPPLIVERWPSEVPLAILVAFASLGLWILLAVSILGLVYAAFLALFFFFLQIALVTFLRGSAVRLGPDQFPELWERVAELARRAGLADVPEAYLLQQGGSLNAFATRFLRRRMIALYTDLIDACGDDHAARDMVIGHELGHLKARHLDFVWLLLPGMFVPFLGAAYSRARELTCDRYGAALCGDPAGAARGLAILAAGGKLGPQVNLQAFVAQRRDLDTGWMTLGRWLGSYPPLSARVEAIRPELGHGLAPSSRGPLRAAAILLLASLLPATAAGVGVYLFSQKMRTLLGPAGFGSGAASLGRDDPSGDGEDSPRRELTAAERTAALAQTDRDFSALEALLREEWAASHQLPTDGDELAALWERRRAGTPFPSDPFDGTRYGYIHESVNEALVFSSGPDSEPATADDLDHPVRLDGPGS